MQIQLALSCGQYYQWHVVFSLDTNVGKLIWMIQLTAGIGIWEAQQNACIISLQNKRNVEKSSRMK